MAVSTITIASELELTEVLNFALHAFRRAVIPLSSFSTNMGDDMPLGSDGTITIPTYGLSTGSVQSRAAEEDYFTKASNTQTSAIQMVADQNKLVALSFTTETLNRRPAFNPEVHGRLKGEELAYEVVKDVLSLVTAANFPGATLTAQAAASFDTNDTADLARMVMEDLWPEQGRSMLLNPAFYTNLVKQPPVLDYSQSQDTAALREAAVRRLSGFDVFGTAGMPANGAEKLAGFVCLPSALLVGFSPLKPSDAMMKDLADYRIVSDDATGVVLEYKHIVEAKTSREVQVIECNYGRRVGRAECLKRIVTP